MTETSDDVQLWQAYREGNQEALSILAKRYYRTLNRYGRKFSVDAAVVEDCIQELFLELWQKRSRIGTTASVQFYLLKSVRHRILRYHRYQQRLTSDDGLAEVRHDTNYAEKALIEQETLDHMIDQVKKQLASLPSREREALYLRYYENLSIAQIADIMQVNRQSVSNLLQKALMKLRERWIISLLLFLTIF